MTYKTILVHVDERPRRALHLELAFQLAGRFDAHLVALFALRPASIPGWAFAEAAPVMEEIDTRRRSEAIEAAEREFRAIEQRRAGKSEWRVSDDAAAPAVRLSARYSDLVVLGQPEPRDVDGRAFAEDVLLTAGRPVLFVPYAGRFSDVGKRVLVAWNASAEAARALTDALPLLSAAQSVEVVAFDPGPALGPVPGADISLFLARHGVKASAARQTVPDVDVGAQMLSRASDIGADLIVMGAYGHSRMREVVLGGATRTLLDSMTVPVLMAH